MKQKDVNIIGAGIAGLTAGCYLQKNGFKVTIYESHNISGGLCTSWKRNDYMFDGCIHSTIAQNDKYKLSKWFSELIDYNKINFHYFDELSLIKLKDGKEFHFYTNPDKLKNELLKIAPEDGKFINDMITGVKAFAKHDLQMSKPVELWTPLDYYLRQFITAPYVGRLSKWSKSLKKTIEKCSNPTLKEILNQEFFTRYPFYFFLISLGQIDNKSAGYPIGGSRNFVKQIENKFISLGGKIRFNSKVSKIIVRDSRAAGIILENGEIIENKQLIISASDGYNTNFNLLEGKFIDKKIKERYKSRPKWPSVVLVSLGISRTFANESSLIDIRLNDKLKIDDQTETDNIPVTIYNFDPTLAPKGKTCLRVILHADNYLYWDNLRNNDPKKYIIEKNRIGNEIIEILEKHIGNIKNCVEQMDISTPATFSRYTNNWNGSIQGWEWLPGLIPEHMKNSLSELKNFWMTGQWTMPGGGVAGAFINARDLARIICANYRIKFKGK